MADTSANEGDKVQQRGVGQVGKLSLQEERMIALEYQINGITVEERTGRDALLFCMCCPLCVYVVCP